MFFMLGYQGRCGSSPLAAKLLPIQFIDSIVRIPGILELLRAQTEGTALHTAMPAAPRPPPARRTHHEAEAPLEVDVADAAVPFEEALHVLLPGGGVQPPDEDAAAAHGWGRGATCGGPGGPLSTVPSAPYR